MIESYRFLMACLKQEFLCRNGMELGVTSGFFSRGLLFNPHEWNAYR